MTSTPGKGGSPRNRPRTGSGSSPTGPNGAGSSNGSGSAANGQRKRTSAAGSTNDEVTIKTPPVDSGADSESASADESGTPGRNGSDADANGVPDKASAPDKAEDTVVDLAAKKQGSNDTVVDLAVGSIAAAAGGGSAGNGTSSHYDDKLVAGDGKAKSETESGVKGDSTPVEGRPTAMDFSAPSPGYGGSTSTTRTSGSPSFSSRGPSQFDSAPTQTPPPQTPPVTSSDFPLTGSDRSDSRPTGSKRTPRKALLQVARFDPWSVMKFSFIMSLVCFIVLFVAVAVLYMILSGLGVFDSLASTIRDLTSSDQSKTGGVNPAGWFSASRILFYTALIGALNVLLITALATVWSVIYNLAADLVGGVEVTLKEAE